MMSSKRLTARERNSLESIMEKRNPDGPLQASCTMLHGFLTAIISGPLVPASEWTPVVFGDDASNGWESLDKAKRGYELLMRFNNEIAGDLLPEGKEFAIIIDRLGDPPEHLDLADDWCEGYMIGTSLREREWTAAMQDPVVGPAIEPIRILGDRKHPRWRKVDHDGAEYRAIMDQLPVSAVDIWDWWRGDDAQVAAGDSAKVVPFRRPTPKISPNAPCPCGSGKKYKRCCGAR